jgi:F-type H+-transporting ATPase subunit b
MQIDWLTVAAQVVNFLVLVYLLKRFLYAPVIAAMTRRQQRVMQELADAAARERDADVKAQAFQQKTDAFERSKAEMLDAAARDVEVRRKALLDEARREVDATRATWRQAVVREQREFLGALRGHAAVALVGTARRLLSELADAELERQVVRVFVRQLAGLDAAGCAALRSSAPDGVTLTSAFELDAEGRAAIEAALERHVFDGALPALSYTHAEQLICGIELHTAGYKLGWSLDARLQSFEDDVVAALPSAMATGPAEAGDARNGR